MAPGGRSGQIFEIFEILGGAGDIHNTISMHNHCDGPYIALLLYASKDSSAWTEVWTGTCRSTASIGFPGSRSGHFLEPWVNLRSFLCIVFSPSEDKS